MNLVLAINSTSAEAGAQEIAVVRTKSTRSRWIVAILLAGFAMAGLTLMQSIRTDNRIGLGVGVLGLALIATEASWLGIVICGAAILIRFVLRRLAPAVTSA